MRSPTLSAHMVAVLLPAVFPALNGCSSQEPPQSVLSRRCLPIGGAESVEMRIASPRQGTLRVVIEQHGISVVTTLVGADAGARGPTLSAISPIERFGLATF